MIVPLKLSKYCQRASILLACYSELHSCNSDSRHQENSVPRNGDSLLRYVTTMTATKTTVKLCSNEFEGNNHFYPLLPKYVIANI